MTRDTGWFKSSYSDAGNDDCVEVRLTPDAIGVRDSKAPAGGTLLVTPSAWAAFVVRQPHFRDSSDTCGHSDC